MVQLHQNTPRPLDGHFVSLSGQDDITPIERKYPYTKNDILSRFIMNEKQLKKLTREFPQYFHKGENRTWRFKKEMIAVCQSRYKIYNCWK